MYKLPSRNLSVISTEKDNFINQSMLACAQPVLLIDGFFICGKESLNG